MFRHGEFQAEPHHGHDDFAHFCGGAAAGNHINIRGIHFGGGVLGRDSGESGDAEFFMGDDTNLAACHAIASRIERGSGNQQVGFVVGDERDQTIGDLIGVFA